VNDSILGGGKDNQEEGKVPMSRLRVFNDDQPAIVLSVANDSRAIAAALGEVGVGFERWEASAEISPGAPPEEVIAAYRPQIDRLMREKGYQSVDVVSLSPDHPDREALRRKFLDEHTHSEDEVRFFVGGSGLFSLHIENKVYEVRCERGDLISVPEGTPHWFDMGPRPFFIAIRLFTSTAGWVARFTGGPIASQFPRYQPGEAG
jgi:1,2-dihydroxy-3-keto-5-methylthiopentene dioxygenase